MTDMQQEAFMSLEQVRDWLLDLHDNFNGTDPALDDFKFAAQSIEAALRYRDEQEKGDGTR